MYQEALLHHANERTVEAQEAYTRIHAIMAWADPTAQNAALSMSSSSAQTTSASSGATTTRYGRPSRQSKTAGHAIPNENTTRQRASFQSSHYVRGRRLLHLTLKNQSQLALEQEHDEHAAITYLTKALRADATDAALWIELASLLTRQSRVIHRRGIKYALQSALTIAKVKSPLHLTCEAETAFHALIQVFIAHSFDRNGIK